MINGGKVLAVIAARGGSKGLPGKNIRPVAGRPLIAWSIAAAQGSRSIDRTVLSSDDAAIMQAAQACGCDVPFRRPAHLASDDATSISVLLHALDELPGFEFVMLLQATSPLRSSADIDAACALLAQSGAPACVSVCLAEQSPYWMVRLGPGHELQPLLETPAGATRRQDLPAVYTLNGAVYVARTDWLRQTGSFISPQTVAHVMPAARSIDIDTLEDFEAFAKAVAENAHA